MQENERGASGKGAREVIVKHESLFAEIADRDARIHRMLSVAQLLDVLDNRISLSYGEDHLIVRINSIDELKPLRQQLRELLGSWEDGIDNVFASYDSKQGIAVWMGKSHPVQIEMRCPIDEFPQLREGCGFRQVTTEEPAKKSTRWSYVCSS